MFTQSFEKIVKPKSKKIKCLLSKDVLEVNEFSLNSEFQQFNLSNLCIGLNTTLKGSLKTLLPVEPLILISRNNISNKSFTTTLRKLRFEMSRSILIKKKLL